MIATDGWAKFSIWEHSATVQDLYERRCRRDAGEMTAHRQAARLLTRHLQPGQTVLDVGCGSGYLYHSLAAIDVPILYYGVDASRKLLDIGRRILPAYGLPAERLIEARIEDLNADVDHVLCINVLSNIDNFHKPLERLLLAARNTVILRESIADFSDYAYVEDRYLDPGVRLKVHVNTYDRNDVIRFIESYGFNVTVHVDEHSGGASQQVIDHPHWWTFIEAVRRPA